LRAKKAEIRKKPDRISKQMIELYKPKLIPENFRMSKASGFSYLSYCHWFAHRASREYFSGLIHLNHAIQSNKVFKLT
jgi:hypothetical protein